MSECIDCESKKKQRAETYQLAKSYARKNGLTEIAIIKNCDTCFDFSEVTEETIRSEKLVEILYFGKDDKF